MSSPTKAPGSAVKQFSVFLPSRLGALMRLVKLLNQSHVEVLGLSILDSTDATVVRLIVTDHDIVEQVFYERGIPFSMCTIVVVELPDGPAGLGACLNSLLEAEINVLFSYPLLCHADTGPALAMRLEDSSFGVEVLNRAGFKVLCQEDLAR